MTHVRKGHIAKRRRQEDAAFRQAEYDQLTLAKKIQRAYERGGDSREFRRLVAIEPLQMVAQLEVAES